MNFMDLIINSVATHVYLPVGHPLMNPPPGWSPPGLCQG